MDAMQILVIILSVFLAIFLVVSIVLVVLLIKVTQQIRSVTTSAQRTVEKVEGVAANLSVATSPASMLKVAKSFVTNLKK